MFVSSDRTWGQTMIVCLREMTAVRPCRVALPLLRVPGQSPSDAAVGDLVIPHF